jgi:preprotein translocase subunit SecG
MVVAMVVIVIAMVGSMMMSRGSDIDGGSNSGDSDSDSDGGDVDDGVVGGGISITKNH